MSKQVCRQCEAEAYRDGDNEHCVYDGAPHSWHRCDEGCEGLKPDDERTVQAEEPVEDRLRRAYANGLQQGLMLARNILGRWDHS